LPSPWCDFGGFPTDLVVMISALATLLMALATVWMACQTKRSADETAQMAKYTKNLADVTAASTELGMEYQPKPRFVSDDPVWDSGKEYSAKHFRVIVRNNGENVAKRCEGKIEVHDDSQKILMDPASLHWARRFRARSREETPEHPKEIPLEHLIYQMSPVDIAKGDWEYLDMVRCVRKDGDRCYIDSARTRFGWFDEIKEEGTYWAKVTVYCENAIPKCKWFKLSWTGKLEDTRMDMENPPRTS